MYVLDLKIILNRILIKCFYFYPFVGFIVGGLFAGAFDGSFDVRSPTGDFTRGLTWAGALAPDEGGGEEDAAEVGVGWEGDFSSAPLTTAVPIIKHKRYIAFIFRFYQKLI